MLDNHGWCRFLIARSYWLRLAERWLVSQLFIELIAMFIGKGPIPLMVSGPTRMVRRSWLLPTEVDVGDVRRGAVYVTRHGSLRLAVVRVDKLEFASGTDFDGVVVAESHDP